MVGVGPEDWRRAPDTDVQVVVVWEVPTVRRWRGVEDRCLWTGEDEYDPFGWGIKYGAWLARADYDLIWERAAYGNNDTLP